MSVAKPAQLDQLARDLNQASPDRGVSPRVVAIGGGTGLSVVLSGLRWALSAGRADSSLAPDQLTAIVAATDDGGSTGRLRRSFPTIAVGDLRKCLLALSDADPRTKGVFGYRFDGDGELSGHTVGNVVLTAAMLMQRSPEDALAWASNLLRAQGKVLPATAKRAELVAHFSDGSVVVGESCIPSVRRPIESVSLEPCDVAAAADAVAAIDAADLVVLGPGSLFTSLLPVLLVPAIGDALARCRARVALVVNLLTEAGETEAFSAADIVKTLARHVPALRIDTALVNMPQSGVGARDHTWPPKNHCPIAVGIEQLEALGLEVIGDRVLNDNLPNRHDPQKLGGLLVELARRSPAASSATLPSMGPVS